MQRIVVLAGCLAFAAVPVRSGAQEPTPVGGAPAAPADGSGAKAAPVPVPVMPPKLLHMADPNFTKEARRKHISGEVIVELQVGEDGKPRDVHVTQSLGYGLDEEAVKAVNQYRFRPAKRLGVPVAVDLSVSIRFQN